MLKSGENLAPLKPKAIFLTGFMGSGKTSVGQSLAREISAQFCDLDREIEAQVGLSVQQIFEDQGEESFRQHEQKTLMGLIEKIINDQGRWVLSLGGGTLLAEKNLAAIQANGTLIYLKADPDTLGRRILADSTMRPLFSGQFEAGRFEALFQVRCVGYKGATHEVKTDGLTVTQVVQRIRGILNEA